MPGFKEGFGLPIEIIEEIDPFELVNDIARERNERFKRGEPFSPKEELKYIQVARQFLLDYLVELEQMRHEHEAISSDDIRLLDTIVETKPPILDDRSFRELNSFLEELDDLRDDAATAIAQLELINEIEMRLRQKAGLHYGDEEQRAKVRETHTDMLSKEWGLEGEG